MRLYARIFVEMIWAGSQVDYLWGSFAALRMTTTELCTLFLGSAAGHRDAFDLLDQVGFPGRACKQSAKLGAFINVHSNNLKAKLARRLLAEQNLSADFA